MPILYIFKIIVQFVRNFKLWVLIYNLLLNYKQSFCKYNINLKPDKNSFPIIILDISNSIILKIIILINNLLYFMFIKSYLFKLLLVEQNLKKHEKLK